MLLFISNLFIQISVALIATSFEPQYYDLCKSKILAKSVEFWDGYNVALSKEGGNYCVVVPGINYDQLHICDHLVENPFVYEYKSYGRELINGRMLPCEVRTVGLANLESEQSIINSVTETGTPTDVAVYNLPTETSSENSSEISNSIESLPINNEATETTTKVPATESSTDIVNTDSAENVDAVTTTGSIC